MRKLILSFFLVIGISLTACASRASVPVISATPLPELISTEFPSPSPICSPTSFPGPTELPTAQVSLPSYIYEALKEVEALYGIRISFNAGELNGKTLYHTADVTNPQTAEAAIKIVKAAFSTYPEGFFDELKTLVSRDILLYFSNSIEGGPISTNGYFNYIDESLSYICINANTPERLQTDIYHEIWHAIDKAVEQNSNCSLEADWFGLLPEGFRYDENFSAYLTQTNDSLTLNRESNPLAVWFTDAYAKTSPAEDRARVAELIFTGQSADYGTFLHLSAKIEQLKKELKLTFSSFN